MPAPGRRTDHPPEYLLTPICGFDPPIRPEQGRYHTLMYCLSQPIALYTPWIVIGFRAFGGLIGGTVAVDGYKDICPSQVGQLGHGGEVGTSGAAKGYIAVSGQPRVDARPLKHFSHQFGYRQGDRFLL